MEGRLARERVQIGTAGHAGREAERLGALARAEENAAPGERIVRRTRRQAVLGVAGPPHVHRVPADPEIIPRPNAVHPLDGEESLLAGRRATGVARERARAAHDPVAGDDDGKRIPSERLRRRADRLRPADLAREAGVGDDGAVRDLGRGAEHGPVEVAPGESQVEWPLETGGPALEVRPDVPVERVDLTGVLDRLDVAEAPEAGCLDALRPPQVLDEHDS